MNDALAWIAIGAAAGLGGMIHPVRFGYAGVLLDLFAGIVGAVVAGLIGFATVGHMVHARLVCMLFAAAGALLALLVTHATARRPGTHHAR
jgi:uncharacterized membrane protein YeaQ/YmgE (transglycosylase-associated protein family)